MNEDPKDAMIKEYANEIKKLKALLEQGGIKEIPNQIKFENSVIFTKKYILHNQNK